MREENTRCDVQIARVGVLTLGAPIFSHDALHGAEDLLGDGRGQGCGVHGAVRIRAQVVHQLLQRSTKQSVSGAASFY